MPTKSPRSIVPRSSGFFKNIAMQIKLILRLMGDKRVSPILKALPIGALIYLVIPDIALGPVDDAAVLGIGMYLFIELCPKHVVEEHLRALRQESSEEWQDMVPKGTVVEGEFQEVEENHPSDERQITQQEE